MVVVQHIYEKSVIRIIFTAGFLKTLSKEWHNIDKIIYGEDSQLLCSICYTFLTSLREKRLEFQDVKNKIKESIEEKGVYTVLGQGSLWGLVIVWKCFVWYFCGGFVCFSSEASYSLLLIKYFNIIFWLYFFRVLF